MRKDQAYQLYEDTSKADHYSFSQNIMAQNRIQELDGRRLVDQQRAMQMEHIRRSVDIDKALDPLRFIDFPNLLRRR